MPCPHCRSDAVSPLGRCTNCGTAVEETSLSAAVTSGPAGPVTGGDAPTGFPAAPAAGGTAAAAGPLVPGQPFGSRYHIIRVLGAGGMGVVYHAWDGELGVAVALKVIRPEVLDDPGAAGEIQRRFKRELVLARQVTHRNVVRIHDLGEVAGIKYLTMPFVKGDNLATVLRTRGKLPLPQALSIGRQVASGLAAAHEVGVVHRDLKPENIMLDAEGDALIMDFGISRSVSGTGTATQLGAVLGTLEYMPPEQAQGQAVDHRADIYSFGLVLYDLIGGRQRLVGRDNPMSEVLSRMQAGPPPIRAVEPGVPEPVERILARCLAPLPDARYATTPELVADLEALTPDGHLRRPASAATSVAAGVPRTTIAAAALVMLLMAAGAWWMLATRGPAAPPAAVEPVSVLVADFANRAGDPVFEGTLEQALGLALEGASFVTTYPRASAERVASQIKAGTTLDATAASLIALREGIKVILVGEIAKADAGYQISVRALRPTADATDNQVLAEASARAATKGEVLEAVGTVAASIRRSLGDTAVEDLTPGRETFTAASLEAAQAYALAQRLAESGQDENAVTHYERAISLDPEFGRAYSGWASSAFKLGRRDEAKAHYEQALKLLDRMTEREKYRTLGAYYVAIAGDYEKAIENYSTLVEKFPADGAGHNNLAVAYFATLEFSKALEEGRRVLDIYPKSVLYRYNYALYAMYAGDFARAAAEAQRTIELNPNTPKAYLALAMAALAGGKPAEARAAYERAAATGPRGASLASIGLADLAMFEGRYEQAVEILESGIAQDVANQNRSGAATKRVALAEAHQASGQPSRALAVLDETLQGTQPPSILVPAARVLLENGRDAQVRRMADELRDRLQGHDRAYGHLLDGLLALKAGRVSDALDALHQARKLADLWLVRFYLGVAYVQAGGTSYTAGRDEFERCRQRLGEATAVFLDDVPSFRYTVPVWYWLGRAQEGMGLNDAAAESYRTFLSHRQAAGDRLTADARQRLAAR